MIPTLTWTPEGVRFIDQTRLPLEESYVLATTYEQVAEVIVTMVVRGAPAIGVSAAYGVALGAKNTGAKTIQEFEPEFEKICARLAGTRPTAVNLFWALDRMRGVWGAMQQEGNAAVAQRLLAEAHAILDEDVRINRAMGAFGAELLPDGARVATALTPFDASDGGRVVSVRDRVEPGALVFDRSVDIPAGRVQPEAYGVFQAFARKGDAATHRDVVVELGRKSASR